MSEITRNQFWFYLLFHFCFILFKDIVFYVITKKTNSNKNNNQAPKTEIELLTEKIHNLQREAQLHDNPSEFVQHTKITRTIAKLEKELEEKKKQEQIKKRNQYIMEQEQNKKEKQNIIKQYIKESMIINYFCSLEIKSQLEISFWIISFIVFLFLRKRYFVLDYETYQNNIVSAFYYNKTKDQIEIPMNRVLFFETMFIVNLKTVVKMVQKKVAAYFNHKSEKDINTDINN